MNGGIRFSPMLITACNFTFSPDDDFEIKSKYWHLYDQVVFSINIKFKQCFLELYSMLIVIDYLYCLNLIALFGSSIDY